mmetsp:Transcript_29352/g.53841  ORF Transcript_29352/g.53841 Transcript_29352/m.53841 type:complete len:219 (+) Transcript_29352:82-738(+)|eukprot:CAMPEP_0201599026 /NCGR_PEP_ID=MMETSP0492-20130828/649_1 /ASSEMBLY_ACC=CAM_ASM_000837 /TAXON_ID=420259 /ORGANISM="Thalassiosira gravida, Strain GMp14c1" /LENGTH=218 /DNA_ID=CAMNT_0048061547 /DNA_START=53 /DNA_END=709 /DNA_ORIENTATION=-
MMKQSVFLLALAASAYGVELTPENFDDMTEGKTVFLKFFAPWCGHCKAIKPDWDKLIDEFAGSETQLIADVDCTAEGEPLCEEAGIEGFPSLKWGDPADLQDYDGGRSYEDLKTFATENLKPLCSIKNVDLCDDDKKAQIKKYQDMTVDALLEEVESEAAKVEEANETFEEEVQKLQEKFEQLSVEKDAAIAAVNAAGLGLAKSVLKSKQAPAGNDEL